MAELVRAAQLRPVTRDTLKSLFRFRQPSSVPAACSMFARWTRSNTVLMNEYNETLQDPAEMLEEIGNGFLAMGDCDDVAMLTGTLLAASGLNVRFVAALAPDLSGNGHVWAEAWDNDSNRWQRSDPATSRTAPRTWPQLIEEL